MILSFFSKVFEKDVASHLNSCINGSNKSLSICTQELQLNWNWPSNDPHWYCHHWMRAKSQYWLGLSTAFDTIDHTILLRRLDDHLYADDSQLYVAFTSGISAEQFTTMLGLHPVMHVMNKLQLKPDKTEFFFIENEWQRNKYLPTFPVELFGVKTNPAKSVQNLGD